MPTVTASIGIPAEMWEKCRRYKINRSALARSAIEKEIERIENKARNTSAKTAPGCTSQGGKS